MCIRDSIHAADAKILERLAVSDIGDQRLVDVTHDLLYPVLVSIHRHDFIAEFVQGAGPVSYTHLDVYKRQVHDLHIWSIASEPTLLSAHLVVRDLRQWETVLEACHTLLTERFGIQHATLQPEPETRTVRWLKARAEAVTPHPSLENHDE